MHSIVVFECKIVVVGHRSTVLVLLLTSVVCQKICLIIISPKFYMLQRIFIENRVTTLIQV